MTRARIVIVLTVLGGCWMNGPGVQAPAPTSGTPTSEQAEPAAPTTDARVNAPVHANQPPAVADVPPPAPTPAPSVTTDVRNAPLGSNDDAPTVADVQPLATSPRPDDEPAAPRVATAAPSPTAPTQDAQPVQSDLYLGGGGFYLPVDNGGSTAAVWFGRSSSNGPVTAMYGVRLAYGDSDYSSVFGVLAEVGMTRWFGTWGTSLFGGVGTLFASRKDQMTGWDGTMLGFTVMSSLRRRYGAFEPSFDLGLVYAIGKNDPAPIALLSLTRHL